MYIRDRLVFGLVDAMLRHHALKVVSVRKAFSPRNRSRPERTQASA